MRPKYSHIHNITIFPKGNLYFSLFFNFFSNISQNKTGFHNTKPCFMSCQNNYSLFDYYMILFYCSNALNCRSASASYAASFSNHRVFKTSSPCLFSNPHSSCKIWPKYIDIFSAPERFKCNPAS